MLFSRAGRQPVRPSRVAATCEVVNHFGPHASNLTLQENSVSPESVDPVCKGLLVHSSSDGAVDAAVDVEQQEVGEEVAVKAARLPEEPTLQERLDHEISHCPYRACCRPCVAGKGRAELHRRTRLCLFTCKRRR